MSHILVLINSQTWAEKLHVHHRQEIPEGSALQEDGDCSTSNTSLEGDQNMIYVL